ncbi:bile salt-activated lipase isoform 2-T2 [Lycaon pictus]
MGRLELVVLGLTCYWALASTAKLGAVYTEGGFVEGVNKKLSLFGDYVDIFKGIPFAAPPKALENPQRHPGWQGTLKAKDFKRRCLQATITQDNTYGEEDCLYLNIWVPQGKKEVSRNLPVMIWIYGGAFLMGAGHGANFLSNYLYDGEEIATRGNVIVVTFNYRVGPLGFLSTGDANLPGNYGLRDQHMAIAWVKRNIAAFGGDPNNITLFGESAGGASVSLQTLSPYNKGLIRRAISQSGVALCPWVIQRNPLFWAKRIAEKVGCPLDDTARMAKCLKVTDPRALTLAYKMPLAGMEYPMLHYLGFIPVVDGDFIPDDPINLYANTADIDYIAGTNNMDGHIFASIDMPAINKNKQEVTDEDFYKLISGLTMIKGLRGANSTFDVYTKPWARDATQETKKKTVVDFETDILFLVPTETALGQHRANAKDPNMGHSAVPIHWDPYTVESGNYLEITKKMDHNSLKQHLRTDYLRYWAVTYQALPTVTGDEATPAPPSGDSNATPAPPSGDSNAPPAPPSGDSNAPPAPPSGDSNATPAPPSGDSNAPPAPPSGDSEGAQMPIVIGF